MPYLNHSNNASTTLISDVGETDNSISLGTGEGDQFPSSDFRVTIWNAGTYSNPADDTTMEIIHVGSRSGDTLSNLTRGVEGTSASVHYAGHTLANLLTAGTFHDSNYGLENYLHDKTTTIAEITDAGTLATADVIKANDIDAESSLSGQVLTSDGAGNATWQDQTTLTDEDVEDIVGSLVVGGTNITVTYSDVDGTLTISNDIDIDQTPADGNTNNPISSDYMYDHVNASDAHHSRYTDAEARAATDGQIDADTVDGAQLADIQAEIDGDISTHASIADVHHAKYTDGEAIAAINGDTDHGSTAQHDYRTDEEIRDTIASFVVGGTNVTITHDDENNTLTFESVDTNTWRDVDDVPVDGATNVSVSSNWAYDHENDVNAHHAKYTDAEARAATDGQIDADTVDGAHLVDIQNEINGDISTHAGDADAHHTRYTDAEAISAVAAADDYVKNTGDTVTGDILIDSNTSTYGLIVSRDGQINVQRIKTTVGDTSVDHEYINDEENGNIIWTIENLDTEASDGSLYNYSQLKFFSDNIDTYLSLNDNKFFHEGFMGSGSGLDADTVDGSELSDIQLEIDNDISTHASDVDAHHTNANDPTPDEKAAMTNANTPSSSNPFATMDNVGTPLSMMPVGFEWDRDSSSPSLRQIDINGNTINPDTSFFDNHAIWGNIWRCVIDPATGEVTYGSNPRGDGLDLTGASGNVMVRLPAFDVKYYADSRYIRIWLSPVRLSGFERFPNTRMRGGVEVPEMFISAFEASGFDDAGTFKLQSATGKTPVTGGVAYPDLPNSGRFTIDDAETYANNIGSGYGTMNIWTMSAIRLLFYTEMGSLNSQTALGRGVVDLDGGTGFAGLNTGADSADSNIGTNGTGTGTGTDGETPIVYRGIENLWGNVWQYVIGYNEVDAEHRITKQDGTGTLAGDLAAGEYEASNVSPITTNGYQSDVLTENLLQYLMIPNSVTGSSSTYLCDYFYAHDAGETNILLSGGLWYEGSNAGVGSLASNQGSSLSARAFGARFEFIPQR